MRERALFVASVSNGVAFSTRTVSSAVIAVSSFTPSNVTAFVLPASTVTVFAAARGVGPSISVSVAVAPVSVFSSATSATTSTGRVESVC